jgi:hypothetical protein
MAKNLTTYQAEHNEVWTLFWKALKEVHPEPLKELNAFTPKYKVLVSANTSPWLSHISLWCHLEEKYDDEAYLEWQSSREWGVKALELARSVVEWQAKHYLTGYWGFERALRLLETWSNQGNWQDMPIYEDYGLQPDLRASLPRLPQHRLDMDEENYLEEVRTMTSLVLNSFTKNRWTSQNYSFMSCG